MSNESEKTKGYRDTYKLALAAQNAGDWVSEEVLMIELDKLWLSMTAAEVKQTELISQELQKENRDRTIRAGDRIYVR